MRGKYIWLLPLFVVMPHSMLLITCFASFIHLLFSFFGVNLIQSFFASNPSNNDVKTGQNDDFYNNLKNTSEDDELIIQSIMKGVIPSHSLESHLKDCLRAVAIRREVIQRNTGRSLESLPYKGFDFDSIFELNCGSPIGYVQIPVGVAGPLLLNKEEFMVPLGTTEGCVVASVNRGCKAIYASGGTHCILVKDGMTRAPVVRLPCAKRTYQLKSFLENPLNFDTLDDCFTRSSDYAKLQSVKCVIVGRNLYIRFCCSTGDAMGMNMVSKGVEAVLSSLKIHFPDMEVIAISGNYCADKKSAAVNWIEGRGKSVVCEAVIREDILKQVLHTSASKLVEVNTAKNLVGSAVAAALGGFNAHASNIVSAIFIATGQDVAQNVESSQCITLMETVNGGEDLQISVSMLCIEVGTCSWRGGTGLAPQAACLNPLGVKGGSKASPGSNSRQLAKIIAGTVLAGELSLMSAIATGELVKSHMKFNRSTTNLTRFSSSA